MRREGKMLWRREPATAEECMKAAEKAFEGTDFEKAVRLLRRAVELEPRNAEVYYALGMSLGMQGKVEEAIAALERAVEWDPGHADAEYALGNALEEMEKLEEAERHFGRSVQIDPTNEDARERLARVRERMGR
jgi:tetratricopeptide (TPR) repeat protein